MSLILRANHHILWATIDRPEALNAVDSEVMAGLEEALKLLRDERDLRVFVVRGKGERAFVSGGDLKAFHTLASKDQIEGMSRRMHGILSGFEALDVFTIACVNGDAYGGGVETLLAMDHVIAAEDVRFGFTQARFHIPPGWGGLTRLVHRVGQKQALGLLGQAAVIDAAEALRVGLIDAIVGRTELEAAVEEAAHRFAGRGRELIAALKEGAQRALTMPRDGAIAAEIEPFVRLWMKDAHLNEVEAFLNGRDAT